MQRRSVVVRQHIGKVSRVRTSRWVLGCAAASVLASGCGGRTVTGTPVASGKVPTSASIAPATVSAAPAVHSAAPALSSAESASRTIDYGGVEIGVPVGWAVVNFDTDPTACRSYIGPALYLGSQAGVPGCPDSSPPSTQGTVDVEPLSASIWASVSTDPAEPTITVNGQLGVEVKGPGEVAFAGLNLLVILDRPDSPSEQAILRSIRQVATIPSPTPPVSSTLVNAAGLVGTGLGWALTAGGLWLTHNDGIQWQPKTPPRTAASDISGVFFADAHHGWVGVGVAPNQAAGIAPAELIYRTDDGGASWRSTRLALPGQQYYDTGYVEWANATLTFVDPLHGWLELPRALNTSYSEAVLYRTIDGGTTWSPETPPPVAGPLTFISTTQGWTSGGVGANIRLYVTTDAGAGWHQQAWTGEIASPPAGPLIFGPQRNVLAVQTPNTQDTGGTLTFLTPTSGTSSWRPTATLPTQLSVQAVAVIDSQRWSVIADPYVYTTTDAGQHWTNTLTTPRMGGLVQLTMATPEQGWALQVTDGGWNQATLDTTHDGGRTWSALNPGNP